MADWNKVKSEGEVDDRRGMAPIVGGVSLTGVLLILAVNYLMGGSLTDGLRQIQSLPQEQTQKQVTDEYNGKDAYEVFASKVLGSNNDTWSAIFSEERSTYTPPKLVLFRQGTESGCGNATSEVGPFYCSRDQSIYLDETFFDELTNRFGAKGGDVAQAYVISHEVGHHIQNELGTLQKVHQLMESDPEQANADSVKLELQADCYAGLWAHSIKDQGIMEPGEINEAMDAAAAVGDDRIQKRMSGYVNPETWTHGSSDQRLNWFNEGYNKGTLSACDTFE